MKGPHSHPQLFLLLVVSTVVDFASTLQVCYMPGRVVTLKASDTIFFRTDAQTVHITMAVPACGFSTTYSVNMTEVYINHRALYEVNKHRLWHELSLLNCGKVLVKIGLKLIHLKLKSTNKPTICDLNEIKFGFDSSSDLGRDCEEGNLLSQDKCLSVIYTPSVEVFLAPNALDRQLDFPSLTLSKLARHPDFSLTLPKLNRHSHLSNLTLSKLDNKNDLDGLTLNKLDRQPDLEGFALDSFESSNIYGNRVHSSINFDDHKYNNNFEEYTSGTKTDLKLFSGLEDDSFAFATYSPPPSHDLDNDYSNRDNSYRYINFSGGTFTLILVGILAFMISLWFRVCLRRPRDRVRRLAAVTIIRNIRPADLMESADHEETQQERADPPPSYADVVNEIPANPSMDLPPAYSDIQNELIPPVNSEIKTDSTLTEDTLPRGRNPEEESNGKLSTIDLAVVSSLATDVTLDSQASGNSSSTLARVLTSPRVLQSQYAFRPLREEE